MTLNKARIIKNIHKNAHLKEDESAKAFETTLEIIKKTLESNEEILISGFGKFFIEENSRRKGSRYINSTAYIPEAKKVVTFRCSPVLVKKLNT
jgi:integration host factor subunit alpha